MTITLRNLQTVSTEIYSKIKRNHNANEILCNLTLCKLGNPGSLSLQSANNQVVSVRNINQAKLIWILKGTSNIVKAQQQPTAQLSVKIRDLLHFISKSHDLVQE